MEVTTLINHINHGLGSVTIKEWINHIAENQIFFGVLLAVFTIMTGIAIFLRKWKNKEFLPEVKEFVGVGTRPRFRKRDKVLFYGRKMLRKVRSISGQVRSAQKKRKLVMKFAKRLLQMKKDSTPVQLRVLEPPAEYLQEELSGKDDRRVPADALYMLQSIRVFGHFEKPIFLKLCKYTDILQLPAGTYLFKIGDADENVYVVQSGALNVFITGSDGTSIALKCVKPGESVTSLLSFVDVLTGQPSYYKTVSARAVEDSTVVRLPVAAFQDVFQEYPDIFIRVLQVIMVRLQRVTFTALHQYLGLSAELVRPGSRVKKNSSPSKTKNKETNQREEDVSADPTVDPVNPSGGRKTKAPYDDKAYTTDSDTQYSPQATEQPQDFTWRRPSAGEQSDSDTAALLKQATESFVKQLGLEDDRLLQGKVEIRDVPSGTYLMKEESHKDVALVYVLSGTLIVSQKLADQQEEVHMFTAHPGEIVGGLAVLTGEPSFFTIRVKHTSRIALISKNTFYSLMIEHPRVVLHVAFTVVKRLSPFVRQVDFALDWVFLESGRALYRQGDESDCTYIVISGRLRSVITHANGKKELVAEYGKGDLVGIVEMVTQTPRSTTAMAVRDSELAKLPEGLFNAIKLRFPIVVTRLINLLGRRILGTWQKPSRITLPVETRPSPEVNFATVAIVPVTDDIPLTAFTNELHHSLSAIGPTLRLTSDTIRKTLGTSIMDPNNEYRLTSWLAQQEDQHRIVLYQCDLTFSAWTQRCVRQADCILIVALAEKGPCVGKIEKEVEKLAIRTQKELVLLHREGGERPQNTVAWLNMRSWVSSHHHIQCPKRMFSRRSQYRINELYNKVLLSEPNVHSDFSRLARWLTGTSVGLVLGGGGARGAAHVGMIKAIQESGIPIDMVGGVSIGSLMGGLWCMEKNITTMTQKAREWSQKMTQWWRQILDITYPATSWFTGKGFNQTIRETFGDIQIEDLWLPYFTITTDITSSSMRLHTHGSLWRYVRASMTLSGFMPPLCDPVDGHLLLDGGYVNNLPADIMRSRGARHILAIDVGSQDDTDLTNYGDFLSGWWLLWKRWNPFASPIKVPQWADIQDRLAYVSCVRQLEEVKNSNYCEYIRPPIDKYRTLQFGSFDEIKDVGYNHGKTYFAGLLKAGALPIFRPISLKEKTVNQPHITVTPYTFTDLAQMVCKVSRKAYLDESEDDYEADDEEAQEVGGYVSEPSTMHDYKNNVAGMRMSGSFSYSENEAESESESGLKG